MLLLGEEKWLKVRERTLFQIIVLRRKEYGGMDRSQAQRLKELERENTRLRKIVSDLSLDNAILKEVLAKNS